MPSRALISENGISAVEAAAQVEFDLSSDCDPSLNLAGFHNTSMEKEIEEVMVKNLV